MKLLARIAPAIVAGIAVLVPSAAVAAAPTPPPGTATAVFTQVTQWPAGYVGTITVRNGTAAPINGWRVEFDLAAGTVLTSSYSAAFSQTGDRYTATNLHWNGTLAPGASTTFGWVARGQGIPTGCTLNGVACDGIADYTVPTRPGSITVDTTGGLVLHWGASTDEAGPVRYQVYRESQLLATVTGTSYVYSSTQPPPGTYVFAVRAVDATGNFSAYQYKQLAPSWRDEAPAAPSLPRVDTPAPGLLRLAWSPSPIPPSIYAPPIAGYEVFLDGGYVGQVGGTMITVAAPPPGAHTFWLRAFNALDRYSTVVQLSYTAG